MRTRSLLAAIAAALMVVLGACGGDDEPVRPAAPAAPERLTRAAFERQANAICRDTDRATRRASERLARDPTLRRLNRTEATLVAFERLNPVTRRGFRRLERLRPPADVEPDFRRFVAGVNEAYGLFDDFARAVRRQDRAALSELTTRFAEIGGPTRRIAQRYGLTDCLPETTP